MILLSSVKASLRSSANRLMISLASAVVAQFNRYLYFVGKIIEPEKQRTVANQGSCLIGVICGQIKRIMGSRKTFGRRKRVINNHFFSPYFYRASKQSLGFDARLAC